MLSQTDDRSSLSAVLTTRETECVVCARFRRVTDILMEISGSPLPVEVRKHGLNLSYRIISIIANIRRTRRPQESIFDRSYRLIKMGSPKSLLV